LSFFGAIRPGIYSFWIALACVSAFSLPTAIPGAFLVEHSPSLTFTNSAFDIGGFECFYLGTCEDGVINTPEISLNSDWLVNVPGIYADSADTDAAVIDGSGIAGDSFLAGNININLIVTLNAAELGGHLATHVGVVCTDIGNVFFSGRLASATSRPLRMTQQTPSWDPSPPQTSATDCLR